jgi:UDP-2,3-diacylglucosamine hydrolase
VAAYFASDVHLRLDCPDRGQRFARWVDRIGADDTLTIVGDLCDFWFAARQSHKAFMDCEGLRAVAAYRARGGALKMLVGNHDLWLGPLYERHLGAEVVAEPHDVNVYGLKVRLAHGHALGARPPWKLVLESRAFLEAFRRLPDRPARVLGSVLGRTNERMRAANDRRHLAVFRAHARSLGPDFDVLALGHLHRAHDEPMARPRLVVLGNWHERASYLKVDTQGAALIVEPRPVTVDSTP